MKSVVVFLGAGCVLLSGCFLSGCSADLQTRLGAEGEVCAADEDCRAELLCEEGLCVDEAALGDPTERLFDGLCLSAGELAEGVSVVVSVRPLPGRIGAPFGFCVTAAPGRVAVPVGTRVVLTETACLAAMQTSGLRFEGQGLEESCGRIAATTGSDEGSVQVIGTCQAEGVFPVVIEVEGIPGLTRVDMQCAP